MFTNALKRDLTVFDFFFVAPYVSNFDFALMHSTRSWIMHTWPQLFVYVEIFSNRASEGYTAGGKHRD